MRLYQFLKDQYKLTKCEVEDFNISHHVRVNGIEGKWLSYILKPDDVIEVDGKVVKVISNKKIYLLLNKPCGIVCTNDKSVPNNIREFVNYEERIFSIGRLDKDSCGLIILTNDGSLFNTILDENNHIEKEYLVRLERPYDENFLESMSKGVPCLSKITKPCTLYKVDDTTFRIILKEGMNRQIRRMAKYFGYQVVYLRRIRIGDVMDDTLEEGKYRHLTDIEVNNLLK